MAIWIQKVRESEDSNILTLRNSLGGQRKETASETELQGCKK